MLPGSTPFNPNPLLLTNVLPIEHLCQLLRLQESQINNKGIISQKVGRALLKAVKEYEKKQARAEQKDTAPEPRVPTHEHIDPRVPTHEQEVPRVTPRVNAAIKYLQEMTTKSTAAINTTPKVTRTRGAQTMARQLQAAAKKAANKNSQGPAGNTRSKSHNTLLRAMYAACFINNEHGDAQRLASWRYLAAMFVAAFTVMNIKSGDMMKHWQLINHTNPDIHRIWNTSTANKIGRLFQGVGNQIKDSTNTCHSIAKEQVPDNHFRDVTYVKFKCIVQGAIASTMQATWERPLHKCF